MKEKTIVICNQKGGVGKTFLADELAFYCERNDVPYSLVDLDRQGGAIHPETTNKKARYTLVDTPGAKDDVLEELLKGSDMIIIPTRMTERDFPPLRTMLSLSRELAPKTPVLVVCNGWTRYTSSTIFETVFTAEFPGVPISRISQSEVVGQAAITGQSVVKYKPRSTVAKQVEEFCQRVFTTLN